MLRTTYTRSVGARLRSGGGGGGHARLSSTIRHSSSSSNTTRPATASSSSAAPAVTAVATLTALSGLSYFAGTRHSPATRDVTTTAAAAATGPRPAPELTEPPTDQLCVAPGPSEAEVTHMLTAEAYSHAGAAGSGVRRYDGTRVASNAPCEDRFVHGSFAAPGGSSGSGSGGSSPPWSVWGVFDGHAGWQTAEHLTHQLVPFVRHALERVAEGTTTDNNDVQAAVRRAFVALDDAVIKDGAALALGDNEVSYADKARRLALAYAGSCALLALLDPRRRVLHVACTGDSRAVLGTPKGGGGASDADADTWEATALSEDQTGHAAGEAARLAAAHPGETGVVKDGRVLGIAVSRAFGDGRWKWDLATQHALKRAHNGSVLPADRYAVRTPPYLTAEPVVTSTALPPSPREKGNRPASFLILASDGFWDRVSNAQAVELVGRWLAWQEEKKGEKGKKSVAAAAASERQKPQEQQPPFDREKYRFGHEGALSLRFWPDRTACRDDNVAVHLVRNALGGEFHGMVAGLLATGSPFSRDLRDDITVQVVFFE